MIERFMIWVLKWQVGPDGAAIFVIIAVILLAAVLVMGHEETRI